MTKNDGVVVRAPKRVSKTQIAKILIEKQAWISKKVAYISGLPQKKAKEYVDGETHLYLGENFRLRVVNAKNRNALIQGSEIIVESSTPNNSVSVRTILNLWYKKQSRELITHLAEEVFNNFNIRHGLPNPTLTFKDLKRRWGSCSSKGQIVLNINLIKTPKECIEYVLMHEYCHLVHHNHSKAFYSLLQEYTPNWKQLKKTLDLYDNLM
ncbi:M48 family metallopeptidase [Patescibacteria group bacterium]|nr:M48 family metallopeptidase [Patescibacteria group bacterium]